MTYQTTFQDRIQAILNKADIVQVISRRLSLTKAGRGWMSACPFHLDKAISFHVFTDTQKWRCFGDCATGGDVINFVMRADGLTFGEAVDRLALQLGIAQTGPSGDRLGELTRDHGQAVLADDQAGGRASQSTVSDIFRERAAEKQVAGDREAPDDPAEYLAWLRQRRRHLESRLRRDEVSLAGLDLESRGAVLGNLACHKGLAHRRLRTVASDLQAGIVIARYHNLQPHLMLEEPSGETRIVDATDYLDAGQTIWTEKGTAIIKDLQSGSHGSSEVAIDGFTPRGFLLLRPPGQRNHAWYAPRSPMGENRPTYLADGSVLAVESFDIDSDLLPGYKDLSGVFVELQDPERSSRRHRDHLGLGH